jgi:leucyl-tRNA synthetase
MFVAPFEETVQWSKEGIRGSSRFLGRVYRLVTQYADGFDKGKWRSNIGSGNKDLRRKSHQTVAKVGSDMDEFHFNTVVASLMEWLNAMYDVAGKLGKNQRDPALDEAIELLVQVISPIAPHLADELWEKLGQTGFLYKHPWPEYDPEVAKASEITLIVQVNGKVRDKITADANASNADLKQIALASPRVIEILAGNPPKKVIVVPGKLVNIVA